MDSNLSNELEDLIKCSSCHLPFNDGDAVPKIFDCRHYFCLKCVNSMLRECSTSCDVIYCIHCWKRTTLRKDSESNAENLPTHKAILYLSKNFNISKWLSHTNNHHAAAVSYIDIDGERNTENTGTSSAGMVSNAVAFNISNSYFNSNSGKSRSMSVAFLNSLEGCSLASNTEKSDNSPCSLMGDVIAMKEQRTFEVRNSGENCLIHAMPITLWCNSCSTVLCRGCATGDEHRSHIVKNQIEAKQFLQGEISQALGHIEITLNDVQHLMTEQRNFLNKILECLAAVKAHIETELLNQRNRLDVAALRDAMVKFQLYLDAVNKQTPKEALCLYATVQNEKSRIRMKYQELFLQNQVNEFINTSNYLLNFGNLKQFLQQILPKNEVGIGVADGLLESNNRDGPMVNFETPNLLLLLTNFCITHLYKTYAMRTTNHLQQQKQQQEQTITPSFSSSLSSSSSLSLLSSSSTSSSSSEQHHVYQTASGSINSANANGINNFTINAGCSSITTDTASTTFTSNVGNNINTNTTTTINNNKNNIHHGNSIRSATKPFSQALATTYPLALQDNHQLKSSVLPSLQQRQQHQSYADIISNKQACNNLHIYPDLVTGSSAAHYTASTTVATLKQQKQLQQSSNTSSLIDSMGKHLQRNNSYFYGLPVADNDLPKLATTLNQMQQQQQKQQESAMSTTLLLNPGVHIYPIYYFNIEVNGKSMGRILIEVRSDVAPKMSKNFEALVTNELGYGYKGCHVFQCWENESIIAGDFEQNNGRGGRSVYEDPYFMPDDTKISATRGAVGMRRSQRRHDNLGLVGSQFRIILREMRCFTGIFAFVIEGLEIIDKISQTGDASGKPKGNVIIVSCGKYPLN